MSTTAQRDQRWADLAPARANLGEARRLLLEASAMFRGKGFHAVADKYEALAHEIPRQG